MSAKVTINTHPVAQSYAASGEKIIEYSGPNGGGLIAFRAQEDGTLSVSLYRHDDTVRVTVES